MARDTVTVPREVLEEALEYFTGSRMPTPPSPFGVRSHGSGPMGSIVRKLNAALLPALQSVEGGVQGSIATKQESRPESAPRTETAIVAALRECQRVLAMMIDPESIKSTSVIHAFAAATAAEAKARTVLNGVTKSDGGVEGHAVNSCHIDHVVRHAHEHDQGRSALSSPPKYKAAGIKPGPSDQLTKTPSADHDDGNLRGLSAPNHQPHAVSQGWRDDRVAVARALYEVGRKAIEPTLGMRLCDFEQLEGRDLKLHLDYADAAIKTLRNPPLPAPPSPAKTGGAE